MRRGGARERGSKGEGERGRFALNSKSRTIQLVTYSRHRCKHTMRASPTCCIYNDLCVQSAGFERFRVRRRPSPLLSFFSPKEACCFTSSLSTLETGDLRQLPTGRSTPVVGGRSQFAEEFSGHFLSSLDLAARLSRPPLTKHG